MLMYILLGSCASFVLTGLCSLLEVRVSYQAEFFVADCNCRRRRPFPSGISGFSSY